MSSGLERLLSGDIGEVDDGMSTEVPESRRPALVRLSLDIEQLVDELMSGFASRREVLEWSRRLIPRTLGEVPSDFFRSLAAQYRAAGPRSELRGVADVDRDRTLLAALLVERERQRDLDPNAVEELRRLLAVEIIDPAYRRAFRQLRKSATEYVDDEGGSSEHDPSKQRYVAMRPALDELDRYQGEAVEQLLDGELSDDDDLRRWTTLVELATHGEISDDVLRRSVREPSTSSMLTGPSTVAEDRARVLFAGYFLLPAFNRGVRDLRDRAKEEADAERGEKDANVSSI